MMSSVAIMKSLLLTLDSLLLTRVTLLHAQEKQVFVKASKANTETNIMVGHWIKSKQKHHMSDHK